MVVTPWVIGMVRGDDNEGRQAGDVIVDLAELLTERVADLEEAACSLSWHKN